MKILNSNSKNFDKLLDNLLSKRKQKLKASSVSVTKIINEHYGFFSIKNKNKDEGTIINISFPIYNV